MRPGHSAVRINFCVLLVVVVWFTQALLSDCLAASGSIVAWGNNISGQSTIPSGLANFVAVDAGEGNHSLALRNDGTLVGWGSLGGASLTNVMAIAAGTDHNLALQSNGIVSAWGNYFVNGGGSMSAFVPAGLSNVVAIAAGGHHDLALKADGTVVVWGSPAYVASPPAGLSNVVAIAAGSGQNLALLSNGTVTT